MGIIPTWNGNLLAGTLGIYAEAHALDTIARGETGPIDIGEATWADREGAMATSGGCAGTPYHPLIVGSNVAALARSAQRTRP